MSEHRRKLIEVALPLEAINAESAREKSIRHGHPSTLHPWWARRPLAACRAVLFAQLVDDPSSRPDEFPTEDAQRKERNRLFAIIEELVKWDNVTDERVLEAARAEILKSCDGNPPPVLDPFAGGGSIPLEAQRLGLEAYASDLNPVAVLISKALIEIPPRWAGQPPVWPGVADEMLTGDWSGSRGLAEDVRRYGAWMRDRAQERIGHLYPDATLPGGSTAKVIAWIWARTVTCPNPGCRAQMPLMRSFWLSKKKDRQTWLMPVVTDNQVEFDIVKGKSGPETDGTVRRNGAVCLACQTPVELNHVRAEGKAGRMGAQLVAVVAEDARRRVYLQPTDEQIKAAEVDQPEEVPDEELSTHPQYMGVPRYGLTTFATLFTKRQLHTLTTFSGLVLEAHANITEDAAVAGFEDAQGYANAVATYLGLCASKMAVFHCSLSRWRPDADKTAPAFGRQAIAMVWDYAECAPFAGAGGDWVGVIDGAVKALQKLATGSDGESTQADAQRRRYPAGSVISTDPPYYGNVPYADLSELLLCVASPSARDNPPRPNFHHVNS